MAVKEGNSRVTVTLPDELINFIKSNAEKNKRTVSKEVKDMIKSIKENSKEKE